MHKEGLIAEQAEWYHRNTIIFLLLPAHATFDCVHPAITKRAYIYLFSCLT